MHSTLPTTDPFAATTAALDRAAELSRDYLLGLGERPVSRAVSAEAMETAIDEPLPAWCALKAAGRTGYRDIVERCCANAAGFASWIESTPGLELVAPAPLNIVCFRYVVPGLSDDETDALNRAAVTALQADGRAFVTGTVWNGRAAIRAAFDNWATTSADVAVLQDVVCEVGDQLRR